MPEYSVYNSKHTIGKRSLGHILNEENLKPVAKYFTARNRVGLSVFCSDQPNMTIQNHKILTSFQLDSHRGNYISRYNRMYRLDQVNRPK